MSRSQVRRARGALDFGDDDSGSPILHVDMDAFFALVELRDRPELRGKPVVVGGRTRGVVLSATYEARALGIHSAMPIARARKLAPHAVYLPPSHGKYTAVSREVMRIFNDMTPLVEPLSVDEAFLDVSGALRSIGSPKQVAELIRERVHTEQQITCSVGVAPTKFIAKLASTHCKPDGLLVIPHDKVLDFLHPLPISALWGVGERTEQVLARLGMVTVGDIAHAPQGTLTHALGPAQGAHLHALAWGRDARAVSSDREDKSIGAEETFDTDIGDADKINAHLLALSDKVASRLRKSGYVGRAVHLKVRFSDFTTITRSRTLPDHTDVASRIYATARDLHTALALDGRRLRLVGVRVDQLVEAGEVSEQLMLGEPEHGHRDAEVAMDALRQKFGSGAVRPARLLGSRDRRTLREG